MNRVTSLVALVLAGSIGFSVLAQEDQAVEKVVTEAGKINESAAKSQVKIDNIADQIDGKLQQFKALNKEIEGLNVYNSQLQKQIDNQIDEMAALNEAIDEVSVIERQITPLMINMIDGLEQFVQLDVPFLPEERNARIADLRSMMGRADVAREVEFLRLGRTALIYQTRDASSQGVWNKQTRQWEALDSSYRTQITKGLRMAKKQLAPDLLMLPVAITD